MSSPVGECGAGVHNGSAYHDDYYCRGILLQYSESLKWLKPESVVRKFNQWVCSREHLHFHVITITVPRIAEKTYLGLVPRLHQEGQTIQERRSPALLQDEGTSVNREAVEKLDHPFLVVCDLQTVKYSESTPPTVSHNWATAHVQYCVPTGHESTGQHRKPPNFINTYSWRGLYSWVVFPYILWSIACTDGLPESCPRFRLQLQWVPALPMTPIHTDGIFGV
ncbi:hypothetical protein GGX14DRAFT_387749 [Mycena pura]|uniref:Uncharacterized protein n=1 Tax=Mycena pura TaxID=153505 RepID=A0AAD7E1E0_9AGAR|nr:hypothetical protein GGX14DRAFT_387749 [Mycena pura]